MRITIFGTGYVGLVTGACLADSGNSVLCVDVDAEKIERLRQGVIPIHEPGLSNLVERNLVAGRLNFTTNPREGVAHGVLILIAVGTPAGEDGSADLQHVLAVARSVGEHLDAYRVVVDKSTVPVGTADQIRETILTSLRARGTSLEFDVVSNPEFLKEGAAVADFMKPDRVVIGTDSPRAIELLRALYEPFTRNRERLLIMDVRSAELTKYAANAMLATKISFINDLALIAEKVGADIEKVRQGIGSDSSIGYGFIYPGVGYGGSCFPKDVRALVKTAQSVGAESRILQSVEAVNAVQKRVLFERILRFFDGNLAGKTVAVWGLAFKPNTDDMREAPSRSLLESLWEAGARVQAYDPVANLQARRLYPKAYASGQLSLVQAATAALVDADVLAIVTEWQEFRSPDFETIRRALRYPAIFDGRNLYEPTIVSRFGLRYFAIGRGDAINQ